MRPSHYRWRGVDDPSRVDQVYITLGDGLRAYGTATCDTFATVWRLEVDSEWVTRRLDVAARGLGWSRSLVLERDDAGTWTSRAHADGDTDLAPPGLDDPSTVAGADDCDLGLCPLTNTMPIRRLGMVDHPVPETRLVMAWVDVPSLRVVRSEQLYASDGTGRVQFATADRSFRADLDVDRDGIVIDYPELAVRQPPT